MVIESILWTHEKLIGGIKILTDGGSSSPELLSILISAPLELFEAAEGANRTIRWPNFTATLRLSLELKQLLLAEILIFDYIYIHSAFWFIISTMIWMIWKLKITILRDNFKYSKRIIVVDEDDKEDGKKGQRIFCDVEKR